MTSIRHLAYRVFLGPKEQGHLKGCKETAAAVKLMSLRIRNNSGSTIYGGNTLRRQDNMLQPPLKAQLTRRRSDAVVVRCCSWPSCVCFTLTGAPQISQISLELQTVAKVLFNVVIFLNLCRMRHLALPEDLILARTKLLPHPSSPLHYPEHYTHTPLHATLPTSPTSS